MKRNKKNTLFCSKALKQHIKYEYNNCICYLFVDWDCYCSAASLSSPSFISPESYTLYLNSFWRYKYNSIYLNNKYLLLFCLGISYVSFTLEETADYDFNISFNTYPSLVMFILLFIYLTYLTYNGNVPLTVVAGWGNNDTCPDLENFNSTSNGYEKRNK